MKRDRHLIEAIMLKAQSGDLNCGIDGYSEEQVRYHRALCISDGYLRRSVMKNSTTVTDIPLGRHRAGNHFSGA